MRSRDASAAGRPTMESGAGATRLSSASAAGYCNRYLGSWDPTPSTARNRSTTCRRSLDGGRSWTIEDPSRQGELIGTKGMGHGTVPPGAVRKSLTDCPGGDDSTYPDFAMTLRMSEVNGGASRFYVSNDRAHTWKGPYRLPLCGQIGIAARTDYLVNGKHDCMVFVTASKRNHREGRPICLRTRRREIVEFRIGNRPGTKRLFDHAVDRPSFADRYPDDDPLPRGRRGSPAGQRVD